MSTLDVMRAALDAAMDECDGLPSHIYAWTPETPTREEIETAASELRCWVRTVEHPDEGTGIVFEVAS